MTTLIPLMGFLITWFLFSYLLWEVENRVFWFRDLMVVTLLPSILVTILVNIFLKHVLL